MMLCIYACVQLYVVLFNHNTSYEMRISDWSSDVCSSDLHVELGQAHVATTALDQGETVVQPAVAHQVEQVLENDLLLQGNRGRGDHQAFAGGLGRGNRSEESRVGQECDSTCGSRWTQCI